MYTITITVLTQKDDVEFCTKEVAAVDIDEFGTDGAISADAVRTFADLYLRAANFWNQPEATIAEQAANATETTE